MIKSASREAAYFTYLEVSMSNQKRMSEWVPNQERARRNPFFFSLAQQGRNAGAGSAPSHRNKRIAGWQLLIYYTSYASFAGNGFLPITSQGLNSWVQQRFIMVV
jgi:hypothetical protein